MKEVKDRSIIFADEMVRAILDGRKTMTRRVINPQPVLTGGSGFSWKGWLYGSGSDSSETAQNFSKHGGPYGKIGSRLWVRETYGISAHNGVVPFYKSTEPDAFVHKWIRSSYMPRELSRIDLEITNIRVERLQDISTEDIICEGFSTNLREHDAVNDLRDKFRTSWDDGKWKNHKWDMWIKNPFVWVIEFERIKP